jgi:hypothetical protein
MSAFIRVRKATDNKFFSVRADKINAIEDTVGSLGEGQPEQDLVVLVTEGGSVAVTESSNTILKLLADVGVTIAK